ncbi:MurR/RpiR family transcriptional regulator [Micromonospora yasonensis]|uniref:MurR/RpiR family transcriptional regulator n=1 Tax=Micromonospora yasonensis TaxID=1128667 RepID=UPI00223232DC|nr:MurR/RpiR family transcriptional regulator [Micromonospora yasonensis]MCW3841779.1 MurR/RpiR family transcriptional regulator [Micromonospora yasonensis]
MTNSTTNGTSALARLRAARPSLSDTERKVADWILEQPAGLLESSMLDVARACNVSDTTVLRMCRNSGFAGFTDLKLGLAQDLASPTQLIHDDVTPDDDAATVAAKVFASTIQSLRDTHHLLTGQDMARALDLLEAADHVLVGGVGTSGVVAQSFYQRCHRLGIRCDAPIDSQLQIMHASLLRPGDLAVGISYSGATKDVADMLAQARRAGAATLVVTGNRNSHVARQGDIVLVSVSHETRSEPLAARACQMALLDALYVAYSLRHVDDVLEKEKRLNQAIAQRSY